MIRTLETLSNLLILYTKELEACEGNLFQVGYSKLRKSYAILWYHSMCLVPA